MKIVKKDIPLIKEFLKTETPAKFIVSPFKTSRLYCNGESVKDFILILTPSMADDHEFIKQMILLVKYSFGEDKTYKYTKHQRGKNVVITFEEE